MNKVLIFGHKKPDTDSVCGAISLSYLKNAMGLNTEPRVLGEVNNETKFALDYFKIPVPKFLNDVKIQLKDVKYKKKVYINESSSIYETFNYIMDSKISGIPIVNDDKKFVGYVSLKEIASELIINSSNYLNTSFDNIAKTLNASKTLCFDKNIEGNVMAVTMPYRMFVDNVSIDENSIVIVGEREHIIDHVIKNKIKLLIIINNCKPTKEEFELAKKNKVNIIITPYDTFKTSRIITLSNPISTIQRNTSATCFNTMDYLSDFLEVSNKLKHTNYPIINNRNVCEGMLRIIDTHDLTRKKVILVDHNEPEQSVDGLFEADILEIVDHHNLSSLSTHTPINYRGMSVGSVNTIIYTLYDEYNIKIPKDIAGIMLSGIISDTLLFASPTTTDLDRKAAYFLADKCGVDIKKYGMTLLESGVSISGLSKEEIIYKDFKNYTAADSKIGIGQVFTTSFDIYKHDIDEYVNVLDDIAEKNSYRVICLFVTDILNNNSYVLFNTSSREIIKLAYDLDEIKEGQLLAGFVSRKKQFVPLILDIIEKN